MMGKYGEPFEIEKAKTQCTIYRQPTELEAKAGSKRILVTDTRGFSPQCVERLVACANACEGMDDPAAEIARLRDRIAELEQEVDELGRYQ